MRILVLGEVSHNIDPQAWHKQVSNENKTGNKIKNHFIIGSIPWGVEWGLRQTDHRTEFFNFDSQDYIFQTPANSGGVLKFLFRKIRRKLKGVESFDFISFKKDLMKKVSDFKPDLVYVVAGHYMTSDMIREIKVLGPKVFLYTGVFPELLKDYVLDSLPLYDAVFSPEKEGIKIFEKRFGLKNMKYIFLACSPELHRKIDLNGSDSERFKSDIVFIGQYSESRLSLFNEISKYAHVKIFGTRWPEINAEHLKTYGPLWGEELVKAYNGAKIVVNMHQPWVKWGINYRTYEVGGCGTFQLIDEKPGVCESFILDEEVIIYRSNEDLTEKIRYYMEHPEERNTIAKNMQKRVYKDYTWTKHLEEVLRVYDEMD